MRSTRFLTATTLAGLAASASLPAVAAPLLAPHRAVYDLALESASDRSGISEITGRMVYEFNGSACDGYTVSFRFVTQIETSEVSRLTDQQTTTFEDPDGKNFSFVTKSFVDQTLDKEVKGTATLGEEATNVELEKPEEEELSLAATQFPTQHLIELIEKAEQGETFYETTLFDGSEDADRVLITTVIVGKETEAGASDPEAAALGNLKPESYWPVNIAYFDGNEGGGEELPVYQISFKLHDNGVTRDLVMDYGEFAMKGRLVDLSMFEPAEACAQ
jgi:hypothetical protein